MTDNTQTVMLALIISLTLIMLAATAGDYDLTQRYIAAGYTRTTLPGYGAPVWVKPSPPSPLAEQP